MFAIACLLSWIVIRDEPTALIAAVFAAGGVESIIGGIIKLTELAKEYKIKKQENKTND